MNIIRNSNAQIFKICDEQKQTGTYTWLRDLAYYYLDGPNSIYIKKNSEDEYIKCEKVINIFKYKWNHEVVESLFIYADKEDCSGENNVVKCAQWKRADDIKLLKNARLHGEKVMYPQNETSFAFIEKNGVLTKKLSCLDKLLIGGEHLKYRPEDTPTEITKLEKVFEWGKISLEWNNDYHNPKLFELVYDLRNLIKKFLVEGDGSGYEIKEVY